MGAQKMNYTITTSPGLEEATAEEIKKLIGVQAVVTPGGGIKVSCDLKQITQVLCGSYLASRVLQPLAEFHSWEKEVLYTETKNISWEKIIQEGESFVMDVHGRSDECDYSTAQGMLKIKDALVDRIRDKRGNRPDVNKEDPTHRIEVYFWKGKVQISIDITGEPMHRRGYRVGVPGPAPLRESRAAALLLLAEIDTKIPQHLYDPFCGTGTIAIEAAMILRKIPPANLRYIPKKGFIPNFHETYLATLNEMRAAILPKCPTQIIASDADPEIVPRARRFAAKARVEEDIIFEVMDYGDQVFNKGVLVSNPPYGERIQTHDQAKDLLGNLGRKVKFDSEIERMVLLVPAKLETATGLKPEKKIKWKAGPLDITAARYGIWRG
jgi:23S rRNA (guanine2445-N2)-methyltransferase / 23S rRNA (guanine2069-N7)-methyltransferase